MMMFKGWRDLKIRNQMVLVVIAILVFSIVVITTVTLITIKGKGNDDIKQYKAEELSKRRQNLKNLVGMAYDVMHTNHQNALNKDFLIKYYGQRLSDVIDIAESYINEKAKMAREGKISLSQAQKEAAEALKNIRYKNGKGYIWINDTSRPFPRMIMHPTIPSLDGKVLDSPEFNSALGEGKNLFIAFVDVSEANGAGFVDYRWPKPTDKGLVPDVSKLSYVRLIKEWGWVIGTGIYVDDAVTDAKEKSRVDIEKMRYDNGTGYFWINDTSRPYPKMIMHPTIPSLDGKVLDSPEFNSALGEGKNLFVAFVDVSESNEEGFVDYRWPKPTDKGLSDPLPKLSFVKLYEPWGWIIGTGVYIDDIDREVAKKTAQIQSQIKALILKFIVISFGIIMGAILLSAFSAHSITVPIGKLIMAMKEVKNKGLTKMDVSLDGTSEIKELGGIFNTMLEAINKAMKSLTETTAAKEKIESELKIAHQIQTGLLPRIHPHFSNRVEFNLCAIMEPAKKVGGDFYDFFFIDESHLCAVIGDVSGKGIPASLFMAMTKTLHKASAEPGITPDKILTRVNSQISINNENCMFVTLFCCILDIRTGELMYANGGHNPPVLIAHREDVNFIKPTGDMMLGPMEETKYRVERMELSPGDILFMFTDGVTEAMNTNKEFFSDERLKDIIISQKGKSIYEIMASVMEEVILFIGEEEQSDDITMLVLRYKGNEGSLS